MMLRAKILLAKSICHPVVGKVLGVLFHDRIPSRGFVFSTRSPVIKPAAKASLFWRTYESAEIRSVRRYLRRDLDVVELGAGIGIISCHLRSLADREKKIISVEANPQLLNEIKNNLILNDLWENVVVVHGAIDYSGLSDVEFSFADVHTGGKLKHSSDGTSSTANVPALTLEQILKENELSEFVLVTDIEGEEANLIEHDPMSLKKCKQIIAEFHDIRIDGKIVTV